MKQNQSPRSSNETPNSTRRSQGSQVAPTNQNENPNSTRRSQGSQVAPTNKSFGGQITDPEILGFAHKQSQAGNAYVDLKKTSAGMRHSGGHAPRKPRKKPSWIDGEVEGEVDGLLSNLLSMTYSYMSPAGSPTLVDASVYVRPKGRGKTRTASGSGAVEIEICGEGAFELGESLECWERQVDVYTQTRPIGYKTLDLFPSFEVADAETQVNPEDLEKLVAALRGLIPGPHNILWSTNGGFTILKAEREIEDYITRCWKVCSRWFYHIQFLHSEEGCYRNRYYFEVKWSMPTKENPIPVTTASVYFSFDVELYSGRDEPVKVHYVLEGTRYPHTPGDVPFQQKWLSGIICEKMRIKRCAAIC